MQYVRYRQYIDIKAQEANRSYQTVRLSKRHHGTLIGFHRTTSAFTNKTKQANKVMGLAISIAH